MWARTIDALWTVSNGLDPGPLWVSKSIGVVPPGLAAICRPGVLEFEAGRTGILAVHASVGAETFEELLDLSDSTYWQNLVSALRRDVRGETSATPDADGWLLKNTTSFAEGVDTLCDGRLIRVIDAVPNTLMLSPACSDEELEALRALDDKEAWRAAIDNLLKQLRRPSLPRSQRLREPPRSRRRVSAATTSCSERCPKQN